MISDADTPASIISRSLGVPAYVSISSVPGWPNHEPSQTKLSIGVERSRKLTRMCTAAANGVSARADLGVGTLRSVRSCSHCAAGTAVPLYLEKVGWK